MPTHSVVLWLFGLSGAGKSTIGDATLYLLQANGILAVRLDGDDLRTGLNSDLGFSPSDRSENLRRSAEVAGLFTKIVPVVICSFITPLSSDRETIRKILGDRYAEVFIKTSLAECERRDPKGLYVRARSGELKQFTGVSAAFEEPEKPDLVIITESGTIEECANQLFQFIAQRIQADLHRSNADR